TEALRAVPGRIDARVRGRITRSERQVQPQLVRLGRAVRVLESRDDPGRNARQQDRDQVGPRGPGPGQGREVREDAGVQDGQQALQLRVRVVVEELGIPVRGLAVPEVLLAQLDHDLVDQGLAEAAHLDPRPALYDPRILLPDRPFAPARGGPDADHGAGVRGVRRVESVPGQVRLRDLDRDRVDVEAFRAVDAGRGGGRDQVQVLERSEGPQVEDRAEVDVEALAPLTREGLHAAAEAAHRGVGQRGVVGRGAGANPDRRGRKVRGEDGRAPGPPRAHDLRHRVQLPHVPVRVREGADRTRVVEERRRVLRRRLEPELVRDVLYG